LLHKRPPGCDSNGILIAHTVVGDDMLAIGGIDDGDIYVALSRGGNHFQVRRVDSGNSVSLAFSKNNRLWCESGRYALLQRERIGPVGHYSCCGE
jgi:hypothetical protein